MCGIVGQVSFLGYRPDPNDIAKALRSIERRGPDGSNVWTDADAVFGHCSLDVMKPATGGKPILSKSSRFVIVLDGEIYNTHELRAKLNDLLRNSECPTDAEIILAAYEKWGEACLQELWGMFAFSIWDREAKRLFSARDRLGVKSLYYATSRTKGFLIGSRPRAIFNIDHGLSSEIDLQACRLYLESGYIPAPYSIYASIRKLPPAHYLVADAQGVRIKRYWDYKTIKPISAWEHRSENDLLDELNELAVRCVSARMAKGGTIGTFLSGGIDSSLVTAIYAKIDPSRVKAFTMGFEEKRYDESEFAKGVADFLGVEHRVGCLSVDGLLGLMPAFLGEFDEPFFDASVFPNMAVAQLARQHVQVASTGDGGDEVFGGYHYYKVARSLDRLFHIPYLARRVAAPALRLMPKHRIHLLAGALSEKTRVDAFAFTRSIRKDFGLPLQNETILQTRGMRELFFDAVQIMGEGLTLPEQAMRLDLNFTLPDDYLQKADGSSMAFSLELRDPLVDHRLVEWAQKLPVSWKLRDGKTKYLWRKLAYRYIDRDLLERPKHGFEVPIPHWLNGPLKQWAQDRCNDHHLIREAGLDQKKVAALLDIHLKGQRDPHPLLWATLMLLEFMDHRKSYLL